MALNHLHPFILCPPETFGKQVPRLGLAFRGNSAITPDDIHHAIERGVRFLNWPALAEDEVRADAMSQAVGELGPLRDGVVICAQFGARTGVDARRELNSLLSALGTDYVDVLTLYYVEEEEEWLAIRNPRGALEYLREAKRDGVVRKIGVTTHQRPLAAKMARSGELDAFMIRYNAAHRGAEQDLFPVTTSLNLPVICYTATRWGALMRPFSDKANDIGDSAAPTFPAPLWYRFVLQQPAVSIVLCAPANRVELNEDLSILSVSGPLSETEYEQLARHGERIRKMAGRFE